MQLCRLFNIGCSDCFPARALDFIAGYPAKEGKLTSNRDEIMVLDGENKLWKGRIKCFGYAIAHAISIPISPLVALVRIVAMPILFGMVIRLAEPGGKLIVSKFFLVAWLKEFPGVITSPFLSVAGCVRAASGIIFPKLYLKDPLGNQLSETQKKQIDLDDYNAARAWWLR